MARPEGFEPPTTWFEARYSIQLSYGRAASAAHILLQPHAPGAIAESGARGCRCRATCADPRGLASRSFRNPARKHDSGHKSHRFPPQRMGIPTLFAYVICLEGLKNSRMSIRFKVIGSLALLFAALSVAAFLIQLRMVEPSFARLERDNARTAMKRVSYAIDRDLQTLQIDATDWGNWQDSYHFAQGREPKFVATNFTRTAIDQIDVDSILMVDLKGRVLAWTGDVIPTNLSLHGSLEDGDSLPANFPWRRDLGNMRAVQGFVNTNLGVMLIAGAPILDGTGRGHPVGMVILGRLLTPGRLQDLGSRTQSNLVPVAMSLGSASELLIDSSQYTSVYRSFDDIYHRPVMTLRVQVPRRIEASGLTAIRYSSLSIIVVAVIVLLLVVVLLNRLVLTPLTRMTRHAVAVGESADLSARLNAVTEDEFGQLGREFDRMVARLQEARQQLIDQSFEAGFAEMAKGVLHNLGNALTPLGVRVTALAERFNGVPVDDLERAAAELMSRECDPGRRADLAQFIELGCQHIAAVLRDSSADVAAMSRQADSMRAALAEHMRIATSAEPVFESVRLAELVSQSLDIVPDASRARLFIDTDESLNRLGTIRVVRTVLRLVLQNVIINASEAVRDAGRDCGMLRVWAEVTREAGRDELHLHAQDNGVGIRAENIDRIFHKGYTTKSRGTNHGIGLHWCANAIRALGGRIWATSDGLGSGAAIHVTLPLGDGMARSAS
jgi:two-component system, NtrC family, sensor kinase